MNERRRRLLALFGTTTVTSLAGCVGVLGGGTVGTQGFQQVAKLTAADGDDGDEFGSSVAVSGDGSTAIVGAPDDEVSNGGSYGSVYVFEAAESGWRQQTKLSPTDGDSGDSFGFSVAVSGDGSTTVVGAPSNVAPASEVEGSAYVFEAAENGWSQLTKLTAEDAARRDDFGWSVALSGDGSSAVIGARSEDSNGTMSGSVYVFQESEDGWRQQTKLAADDGDDHDIFGGSVALSNDGATAIIGAHADEDPNGEVAGAAYVFEDGKSEWIQRAKLAAADGDEQDSFGGAVALSNDGTTAMIGANHDDNTNGGSAGSAYVFEDTGGEWSQQTKLLATDGDAPDNFGLYLSISGDGSTAIIGAQLDEDPNGETAGSAYVFEAAESGWNQQTKLAAADGDESDLFGSSVAVSGDGSTAIIGAVNDEDPNGGKSGSAYVFSALE